MRAPSRSGSGRSGTTEGAGAAGAEEAAPQEAAELGPHRRARIQMRTKWERAPLPARTPLGGPELWDGHTSTAKPPRLRNGRAPTRGDVCARCSLAEPKMLNPTDLLRATGTPSLLPPSPARGRGWLPAARAGRARVGEGRSDTGSTGVNHLRARSSLSAPSARPRPGGRPNGTERREGRREDPSSLLPPRRPRRP